MAEKTKEAELEETLAEIDITPFTLDDDSAAPVETMAAPVETMAALDRRIPDAEIDTTSFVFDDASAAPLIDQRILTPEIIDEFRLNFANPEEALARDLVGTHQEDFADRIEKDPNFLTYEGLKNGTATILDFLPSGVGKEVRYLCLQVGRLTLAQTTLKNKFLVPTR